MERTLDLVQPADQATLLDLERLHVGDVLVERGTLRLRAELVRLLEVDVVF